MMTKQQQEGREQHPLIPEDKYRRILELEAKEANGEDYYGDEEEALEILHEFYPDEAK